MPDGGTPEPPVPGPDENDGGQEQHHDDADHGRGGHADPRGEAPERNDPDREAVYQQEQILRQAFEAEGMAQEYDDVTIINERRMAGEEIADDDIAKVMEVGQRIQENPRLQEAIARHDEQVAAIRAQRQREEEANPPQSEPGDPLPDPQPVADLHEAIQEVANTDPLDEEHIRLNNEKLTESYKKATDPKYVSELQKKSPFWYKMLMTVGVIGYAIIGAQFAVASGVGAISKGK